MSVVFQRSFSGGIISDALQVRADLSRYQSAGKTFHNVIIPKTGGAQNRPGTSLVCRVKDRTSLPRLFPFEFSREQTHILEIGNEYIRFIYRGKQMIVDIAGVTTYSGATAYALGDFAKSGGIIYQAIQAGTGNAVSDTDYWYPLSATAEYEIASPWLQPELRDIQFVQSADVMTFVHPLHIPTDLGRYGFYDWRIIPAPLSSFGAFSDFYFTPKIQPPTGVSNNRTPGSGYSWYVTAVSESGEESFASSPTNSSDQPNATPVVISWSAVSNAFGYNVYRFDETGVGLIAFTTALSHSDRGLASNIAETPPTANQSFWALGPSDEKYPSVIAYCQQRMLVANIKESPGFNGGSNIEDVYASQIGQYKNFSKKRPIIANGAFSFRMAGNKVNAVRHILDLSGLVVFTDAGEWVVQGDLVPGGQNPKQYSYNGSSKISPIVIGANAIYVQAQGSIVRDLGFDNDNGAQGGYKDADLTAFASHIFEGREIVAWAYQKTPNSIVYAVRDDGKMVALTYIKEQQILAWHTHETDGEFEDVQSIAEDAEHGVYFIVRRVIDGVAERFIERLNTREIRDIKDAIFMDCAVTYDGRNQDESHLLTPSQTNIGETYEAGVPMSLISSESYFTVDMVDEAFQITGPDDSGDDVTVTFTVTEFIDDETVTVLADKDVPESFQDTGIFEWAHAKKVISVPHLEGKAVSVLADGSVVSSPNNLNLESLVVDGGNITLDRPYGVVQVGLPYISDIETLPIESLQGETLSDKSMLIGKATLHVLKTRGLFVGTREPVGGTLEGLQELRPENITYKGPHGLITGKCPINIEANWDDYGRVFVRQVDPLPFHLLGIMPAGLIPFKG